MDAWWQPALGQLSMLKIYCRHLALIHGFAPRAGLLIMYLLNHWGMLSGGALGSLTVGLVASNAWERGFPRFASLGSNFDYSPACESSA